MRENRVPLVFILLIVVVFCIVAFDARAGGDRVTQSNDMNNQTTGDIVTESAAQSEIAISGEFGGKASNEGNKIDASDSSKNSNTNIVLAPNNNTSGCLGVYGFAFGNDDDAAALGIPRRDPACDYEQAADDAAAIGEHDIAWYWRCHKKNIYKPFRDKGESTEEAVKQCFEKMSDMLGLNEPSAGMIEITEDEYEELILMADNAEHVEEHIEQTEYRYVQQQSLIDGQEAEIDRLKQEAAALRAKQEVEEAQKAKVLELLRKDDGSESDNQ